MIRTITIYEFRQNNERCKKCDSKAFFCIERNNKITGLVCVECGAVYEREEKRKLFIYKLTLKQWKQ